MSGDYKISVMMHGGSLSPPVSVLKVLVNEMDCALVYSALSICLHTVCGPDRMWFIQRSTVYPIS